jgi:hypothetical protein
VVHRGRAARAAGRPGRSHRLRHDRLANRKALAAQQRVDYLVQTYRAMAAATNQPLISADQLRALERASDDVYLFGTEDQQRALEQVVEGFQKGDSSGTTATDPQAILSSLRKSLRKELGIEGGIDRPLLLRFQEPDQPPELRP